MRNSADPVHLSIHNRYWAQVRPLFFVAFMAPMITNAQTDTLSDANVNVEVFAPAEIEAGQPITLYARVENLGDHPLEQPSIRRAEDADDDLMAGYRFVPCVFDCISAAAIAPGEALFVQVGSLYYADMNLGAGEFLIDDFQLQYLSPESSDFEYVDLEQVVDVRVIHTSGVDINPELDVEPRDALQIADLSEAGDGLLLHDPNTGYDWVRFDATSGLVTEEILAALAPGGRFEGYELARLSQVEQLLMNHMHASGLVVQLGDIMGSSDVDVVDALIDFMELTQHHSSEDNMLVVEGAVADGRIFDPAMAESMGGFRLEASHDSDVYQSNVSRVSLPLETWESADNNAGVWLVRTPETPPQRPADRASFYDDELVLPVVRIDGVNYRVTMRLIDAQYELLRISSLEPATATVQPVLFDEASGTVTIPDVVIMDDDGEDTTVSVTLALVESTGSTIMQVVHIQ